MYPQVLATLPGWLSAGLLFGVILTGVIGVVFLIGISRFPSPGPHVAPGSSITDRRRRALARYLRDAGEQVHTRVTVRDVSVAVYLPMRDVALVFAPYAYFTLRETPTQVILCELEARPAAIARRLPFLTPPHRPGSVRSRSSDAYAVLGVSTDADAATLRDAYRRRVKDCHPDQGGDPAEFARVQRAYEEARTMSTG
jgi:hypothetical protein